MKPTWNNLKCKRIIVSLSLGHWQFLRKVIEQKYYKLPQAPDLDFTKWDTIVKSVCGHKYVHINYNLRWVWGVVACRGGSWLSLDAVEMRTYLFMVHRCQWFTRLPYWYICIYICTQIHIYTQYIQIYICWPTSTDRKTIILWAFILALPTEE